MKTWHLPALAFATAPLFGAFADPQDTRPRVADDASLLANTRADEAPASARPSDEAIRKAVREVLDEQPDKPFAATGKALSGGPYREFSRQFSAAEKPHCLGPDPLKHQPHSIQTRNWVFGAGGIFAAPFWVAAMVRGKCSWTR